jgi:hypothetical protein
VTTGFSNCTHHHLHLAKHWQLGDKAYCDRALEHQIVAPIKARHHRSLLDVQQEYNDLHAWYRASIEHLFGYLKRFRIIGNDVSFIIVIHHDV